MLTPNYLRNAPEALVELYANLEADILADMARRINTYDYFIPAAEHQLKVLDEMGQVRQEVFTKLSHLTGKTKKELETLMIQAGIKTIQSDDRIYRAAGLKTSPLSSSMAMQQVLNAGIEKTEGLFTNLTKTTANTASRQFERALDQAYMKITSGGFDRGMAVHGAIKELCHQGVAVMKYPTGHKDTIEVAVRRAVVTGVNQTALKLQEARADELGVDLVETTAHAGARPSHAVWQGKIFSRSGKSSKYPDFVSSTGYGTGAGLGGWNCRHSFFPYIEGSPRAYSVSDLKDYNAKNYSYNGQKMTEYEASQEQRHIERQIRRWKRENLAMDAAGLDTSQSAVKIRQWQETQQDFIRQTGLKRQFDREQVGGWGRSEAAKAAGTVRKVDNFINAIKGTITSTGVIVTEAGPHIYEQANARGVNAHQIVDALTNPLKTGKIRIDKSQQFIGEFATAVVNTETGKAITTWKTSSAKASKLKGGGKQ